MDTRYVKALSLASLLAILPLLSSSHAAASVTKGFSGSGEARDPDASPGYGEYSLTGSITYVDPHPAKDDVLGLDALIGLNLELWPPTYTSTTGISVPYAAPPGVPDPMVTIRELGNQILVDLSGAYTDFNWYGQEDWQWDGDANSWDLWANDFTWSTGHGEYIEGAIAWSGSFIPDPEPGTLFLVGSAILYWQLRRRGTIERLAHR